MSSWSRTRESGHCVPGSSTSAAPSSPGWRRWRFSAGQTAHPLRYRCLPLVVAVLTTAALPPRRIWPGPVFLCTVLAAAYGHSGRLRGAVPGRAGDRPVRRRRHDERRARGGGRGPAVGQGGWHHGWLAVIYEVISGYNGKHDRIEPKRRRSYSAGETAPELAVLRPPMPQHQ